MSFEEQVLAQLRALEDSQSLRSTLPFDGAERTHPALAGRPLLAFCSNDYLGLANHPALLTAAMDAGRAHGFGSGASRLVSGESSLHTDLEAGLADFTGQPAALLFPTGYQANMGVVSALAGPDDLIVSDAANHASIIDGCRLSRARIAVYKHADADAAAEALATAGPFRRRLLVTESLFSMDGDRAPLVELERAARAHAALLVVDEAHALGATGPGGRGLCAALGVRPTVLLGTLGKAFGTAGGFAATTASLRSLLINLARTFVFTTAAPHPVLGASLAALRIITSPEGDTRRRTAAHRAEALRRRLEAAGHPIPGSDLILPLRLGTNANALRLADILRAAGVIIPAIRPPTVPEGTARLRITISAAHTPAEVDQLATLLARSLSPA